MPLFKSKKDLRIEDLLKQLDEADAAIATQKSSLNNSDEIIDTMKRKARTNENEIAALKKQNADDGKRWAEQNLALKDKLAKVNESAEKLGRSAKEFGERMQEQDYAYLAQVKKDFGIDLMNYDAEQQNLLADALTAAFGADGFIEIPNGTMIQKIDDRIELLVLGGKEQPTARQADAIGIDAAIISEINLNNYRNNKSMPKVVVISRDAMEVVADPNGAHAAESNSSTYKSKMFYDGARLFIARIDKHDLIDTENRLNKLAEFLKMNGARFDDNNMYYFDDTRLRFTTGISKIMDSELREGLFKMLEVGSHRKDLSKEDILARQMDAVKREQDRIKGAFASKDAENQG